MFVTLVSLHFVGFGPFGEHTVNASWVAVQVQWLNFYDLHGNFEVLISYSHVFLKTLIYKSSKVNCTL